MIGDEALAPTLARYTWVIGIKLDDRKTDPTPRQIYKAAETLSRALPWYNLVCRAQIDVAATLATLGAIKTDRDLAIAIKPVGRGRPLEAQRHLCARIVVRLWKQVHGKVNPRSEKLYRACHAYWRASGREPIDDISNWRINVEEATRWQTGK
jgi:hypothetical protein